ncbi:MAG: phosphoribosylformylglycinamidine synthase subunit PurL [Nitrososphaerales archaeon]|nr:phosphoribosylformylglycinamidine synthase subunit PurL [Nitrososphaerales archaeon]
MLGREPNTLELAMIDAEWSEHCSYKSSKSILKLLPTKGPRVVIGPGYDAGAIDVGDGYVVTLHIESHNHPSAIDPYGGAATGIGGVLRDILCMGTRPIALLDSLRFGNIEESAHSRWLFRHVVSGISDYGNCVGVPTIAGEVEFDDCFERNCLVDVVCLGLSKINDLVLAEAKHPGDSAILVGGSTGRDGIHGVTFASRVLTEKSDKERSAVQIPDPFMKKLIIEATLEAIATGHVRGLKDLGGGGITCGLSEMADKGGCGIDLELSKVHLREKDLDPVEIMISESQERMVFIVEKGHERDVCEVFEKYELPYSIIGRVTDGGNLIVRIKGVDLANLPVKIVANAPIILRKAIEPDYIKRLKTVGDPGIPKDLSPVLLKMLSCPSIASKGWVYEQYDHEVGIRTVVKPGKGDASVLRLPNGSFLAIKVDGNSKHCYIDPYNGAAGCLAEACRNLVSVGAEPLAFVDHLQFGDPGNPEVFWTFSEAVRGLSDFSKALGLPCIGGKVSFYNEDIVQKMAIKPSPAIAAIGRIERQEWITTMNFKHEGDYIVIVGETKSEMGGSEYYEYIHGVVGGNAPKVNSIKEKAAMDSVKEAIRRGIVKSVHDLSKGGMAVALAEMCMSGGMGASIDYSKVPAENLRVDEILFSETYGRFLLEVDNAHVNELLELMRKRVSFGVIGKIEEGSLDFSFGDKRLLSISIEDLKDAWTNSISRCMGEV